MKVYELLCNRSSPEIAMKHASNYPSMDPVITFAIHYLRLIALAGAGTRADLRGAYNLPKNFLRVGYALQY